MREGDGEWSGGGRVSRATCEEESAFGTSLAGGSADEFGFRETQCHTEDQWNECSTARCCLDRRGDSHERMLQRGHNGALNGALSGGHNGALNGALSGGHNGALSGALNGAVRGGVWAEEDHLRERPHC